jgi:methionyl-tRNA formyltransferase
MTNTSTREGAQLRILFLGSNYNVLSLAALGALLDQHHHVTVGLESLLPGSWSSVVSRSLRRHGLRYVAHKIRLVARARARIALRRCGVSLTGYASLEELQLTRMFPLLTFTDPNQDAVLAAMAERHIDLVVVAAFGRILRRPFIEMPRLGCLNVHPSLLPRHRGPNPFYWALACGDRTTGVTIHYIDQGIDCGAIVLQHDMLIRPGESELSLQRRAAELSAAMLHEVIPMIACGDAPSVPQEESLATYESFPPRGASLL